MESELFNKEFYRALEGSIGSLPQSLREELYRPCAEGCVKRYVLAEQQRQFDECGKNLDLQYEKYGRSPYFFADIIEKGHVYEIGYPTAQCLCPMVSSGMAASSVHCECSRQSMLCVLETLLPDRSITVELLHSVLTGEKECRFRVVIK
ncbi:MAG: hypothetical protein GX051_10695 [Clostridiales bacterium]|nr:hypothetical protein [Clostridiales bacterium]